MTKSQKKNKIQKTVVLGCKTKPGAVFLPEKVVGCDGDFNTRVEAESLCDTGFEMCTEELLSQKQFHFYPDLCKLADNKKYYISNMLGDDGVCGCGDDNISALQKTKSCSDFLETQITENINIHETGWNYAPGNQLHSGIYGYSNSNKTYGGVLCCAS